jgi:hypothetical protein
LHFIIISDAINEVIVMKRVLVSSSNWPSLLQYLGRLSI